MSERRDDADPEPIPGLEVLTPRVRVLLLALAAVALLALLATAYVPRTLDEGRTVLATDWTLEAAPRLRTPALTVTADDTALTLAGTRWPGRLQVAQVRLGPDAVAAVGTVPDGTRSVRLTTGLGTVHESRVHRLAWQHVHATVLDGPVEVVEAVAIGADGQVLAVLDDLPAPRALTGP